MSLRNRRSRPFLALSLALLLSACGGGGGGGDGNHTSDSTAPLQSAALDGQDPGWSTAQSARLGLQTSALPETYLKGRDWALAAPTDVASVTRYSASFQGRGWYVDPDTGDDSGPGTQDHPWRTLQRAASASFARNDALLLRCGKTFRETLDLTSAAAPAGYLLIAGYGDCTGGQRPTISGADLLSTSGWSKATSGTDQTMAHALSGAPSKLFFNGQPLIQARHPNSLGLGHEFAHLRADGSNRNRFFLSTSDTAALARRDLVGAAVHVRVTPWKIESATIAGHNTSTGLITLSRTLDYAIPDNAGYILEGKLWMLDTPGEWCFDAVASKVYVWGPNNEAASAFNQVEASTRSLGVRLRWITNPRVEWLRTTQHADTGFHMTETHGLHMSSVGSLWDKEYGIQVLGANDVQIESASVTGAGWAGIAVRDGNRVSVTRNLVTDTGLADRPESTDSGVLVLSQNALVQDNVVYRSAHMGIRFRNASGNKVQGNLLVAFCLRLTDCGGIYTFTAAYPTTPASSYVPAAIVSGNTAIGAHSNTEGAAVAGKNMAAGIYLDELTSGAQISNNLVADTEVGIHLHDAAFNLVSDNQIRSASHAGIRGMGSRTDVDALKGNRISGNKLGYFSWLPELPGGEPSGKERSFAQVWYHPSNPQGLFQGATANVSEFNETVGVQSQQDVRWRLINGTVEWQLPAAGWQALATRDTHAAPAVLFRPYIANTANDSLIGNGNFGAGADTWVHYLNPLSALGSFRAGGLPDCSASQSCGRWTPGMTGDYLTTAPFTLSASAARNLYVLGYKVTGGPGGGNTKALIRRRVSPWENYGLSIPSTPVAQGETVTVEQFFRATGEADAVLDFRGQLGGISLYREVSLRQVNSVDWPNPSSLIGHLINARASSASFSCAMLALSTCDVVDAKGQSVSWPIMLEPKTAVSVYARDTRWLRP
jgi:parallel beta-helix repeat protein